MKSKLLFILGIQLGLASVSAHASLTTTMIDESTNNIKMQVGALPFEAAMPGLQFAAGEENGNTINALNDEYKALKAEGKADITFADVAIRFKKSHPKMADSFGVCVLSIAWEKSVSAKSDDGQKSDQQFACEVRIGHVLDLVKDRKLAGLVEDLSQEPFKTEIVRRVSSDKSPVIP